MATALQTIVDALLSPAFLPLCLLACALMAKFDDSQNEAENDEEDDIASDFDFNFTAQGIKDYEELVAQTDARIDELTGQIERGEGDVKELKEELVHSILSRAARFQEEGEDEKATDDYGTAFALIDELIETYGESVDLLKLLAASRLNYAVMLNDSGELSDAEEEYRKAAESNEKLVAFGDGEARLDLVGIKLNLAGIERERERPTESVALIDDAIEEFNKIAEEDSNRRDEALYYLSRALLAKSEILASDFEGERDDSGARDEARREVARAVDVLRSLVGAGRSDHKRDLADALCLLVDLGEEREADDLDDAIKSLEEARSHFASVVVCGQPDASVDLFDASMREGELLLRRERHKEALALYKDVADTFEQFAESDELPLLDGMATAYLRVATLQKGSVSIDKTIEDLKKALDLQWKVAQDLIASLKGGEESDEDHCGHCHDHEAEHCHSHCHGHDHCRDHHCEEAEHSDHCGCGCGCGHCGGETERRFLLENWVGDNFGSLMEILYALIACRMEKSEVDQASNLCELAAKIARDYRGALRAGEKIESEFERKIRDLRYSLS